MPRLAIVISAVGSTESLEGTLVSVLENRPADCEIVVALNRPYADPYDLKDEVRFIPPATSRSTTLAINRALGAVRSPFVHLLASGCSVSEGWVEAALTRFGDRQVGSVAPLVREARGGRILAAGVGYRRHGRRYLVGQGLEQIGPAGQPSILGPCSFAAFYRKAALDFVGGYSTRLGPRQADADLALVLAAAGFTAAFEPRSVVRASSEVDPAGSPMRRALADERLFWRNVNTQGLPAAVAAHAGLVAWEMAANLLNPPRWIAQLAGRLWACCEIGSYARHHAALAAMAARASRPALGDGNLRIDRSHAALDRAETGRSRVGSR